MTVSICQNGTDSCFVRKTFCQKCYFGSKAWSVIHFLSGQSSTTSVLCVLLMADLTLVPKSRNTHRMRRVMGADDQFDYRIIIFELNPNLLVNDETRIPLYRVTPLRFHHSMSGDWGFRFHSGWARFDHSHPSIITLSKRHNTDLVKGSPQS